MELFRVDLQMDRRTDMTKTLFAIFAKAPKNKTMIIHMSSDHQKQRLWKKWEGYHE